jgi:hypothetical protein
MTEKPRVVVVDVRALHATRRERDAARARVINLTSEVETLRAEKVGWLAERSALLTILGKHAFAISAAISAPGGV